MNIGRWIILTTATCFIILALHPGVSFPDREVPRYGGEVVHVAWSLAEKGTFANPFAIARTGTTAFVSPVYPAFYALVIRTLGAGYLASWTLWVANLALLAAALGLLPLLSHRLGFGPYPGTVAAGLGAALLHVQVNVYWELFLATFLGVLVFSGHLKPPTDGRATRLGLLWGTLILTQPTFVLLLAPWSFVWLLGRPHVARRILLVGGMAALIVTPWLVRNYQRFGAFIFVRDELGLELYVSNNSCAAPSLEENIHSGCHALTHPNPTDSVAQDLARAGEYEFFQDRKHRALTWAAANPARFVSLTVKRFALFWFPRPDTLTRVTIGTASYASWPITVLSVPGLWLLFKRHRRAAALIGTTLALYPAVYYVVQFDPRYRYPIYWTSLLLAGIFIAETSRRILATRWAFEGARSRESFETTSSHSHRRIR